MAEERYGVKKPSEPQKKAYPNLVRDRVSGVPLLILALFLLTRNSGGLKIIGVIAGVISFAIELSAFKRYRESQKEYSAALAQYTLDLTAYNSWQAGKKQAVEEIRTELEAGSADSRRKRDLYQSRLDAAYAKGIIPLMYRNRSDVQFLYDYLSSSQESFSAALSMLEARRHNEAVERSNWERLKQQDAYQRQESERRREEAEERQRQGEALARAAAQQQETLDENTAPSGKAGY